jgi:hypothetical protein
MRQLIAGLACLALLGGSSAFARDDSGAVPSPARSHRYVRLPPHHQPREANAPDRAIGPTAKEKAVDRRIDHICRGC